jgi:hypothetical protein
MTELDVVVEIKSSDGLLWQFHSVEGLLKYSQTELNKWVWIDSFGSGYHFLNLIRSITVDPLRNTEAAIQLFMSGRNPASLVDANRYLETYIQSPAHLHEKSTTQHFILALSQEDPAVAIYALMYLVSFTRPVAERAHFGHQFGPQYAYIEGMLKATAFRSGWFADRSAGDLSKIADSGITEIQEFRNDASSTAAEIRRLLTRLAKRESNVKEKVEKFEKDLSEETAAHKQSLTDAWKRLTDTYDEKLALSAPAKYWQVKGLNHQKLGKAFAIAAGLVFAAGAIGIWCILTFLFGDQTTKELPRYRDILMILLLAIGYLWGLRTLMRLTLSHVHLALDASERRTMIISFLALVRKQEVSTEERKRVFDAIFRPSGDGLVKDEGIPLPVLELLRGGK